jgi:hypothetical protein
MKGARETYSFYVRGLQGSLQLLFLQPEACSMVQGTFYACCKSPFTHAVNHLLRML